VPFSRPHRILFHPGMNHHKDYFRLEKESVLDRIGYGQAENPSRRIVAIVDDYVENYHEFIVPSSSFVYRDVLAVDGKKVYLEGGYRIESGVLARLLGRCESAAVFVVTIGEYLEEITSELTEKGMIVPSTILDAIGSGAAENLAAEIEQTVREEASTCGRVISRRFSPGYCDWNVAQQKVIFDILGDDTAGVELTGNMLMMPQKSVSGIIGIGKDIKVAEYNPCITCLRQDCPGRRK
jgi:hypothetical protein